MTSPINNGSGDLNDILKTFGLGNPNGVGAARGGGGQRGRRVGNQDQGQNGSSNFEDLADVIDAEI